MSPRIDAARVQKHSVLVLLHWLNTIIALVDENDIIPQNVYNVDESGFAIESTQAALAIFDSFASLRFQAQHGRQEWVSVVECILQMASIPPLVIFKGIAFRISALY